MRVVNNSFASEAGHWYTPSGEPAYTYRNAKGEENSTTLREARRDGLYPSVTTVSRIVASYQLESWKIKQAILAALTMPRTGTETHDELVEKILTDSREEAKNAALKGEEGHAALERHLNGQPYDAYWRPACETFERELADRLDPGPLNWTTERSFSSVAHGYGGRIDMVERDRRIIIDAKSKDGDDYGRWACYDEHFMQAGAYAVLVFGSIDGVVTGNYFFSRTHPGVGALVLHADDELKRGWEMFYHTLQLWKVKNKYYPGEERRVA